METSKEFSSITDEQLTLYIEGVLSQKEERRIIESTKNKTDLWLFSKICKTAKSFGEE